MMKWGVLVALACAASGQAQAQGLPGAGVDPPGQGGADRRDGLFITPRFRLGDGATPAIILGTGGDPSYSPRGMIVPFGGLHARSAMTGCQDQGVALSAIADTAMAGVNTGLAFHSGYNGGCQSGAASLVGYGSFDGGAVFESAISSYPGVTLSGASYDTTSATFASPMTAAQQATLSPNTYVLTNAIGPHGYPVGSYLVSWTPTRLTTVGWYELGFGIAGRPIVPPARYQPGTRAEPLVYPGQPTNIFTRNTVCAKQPGTLGFIHSECEEVDVVNNTGADTELLNGVAILHMGAHGGGTGLSIGSLGGGYANAFTTDFAITAFKRFGQQIVQTPGLGGVGLGITMDSGIGWAIGGHSNMAASSADALGNISKKAALITDSVQPAPAGLPKGVHVRTQSRNVMAVVPAGQRVPSTAPIMLTFDGGQSASAGNNAFALPGTGGASHRLEAHLTANVVDRSGMTQAMSATVKWTVKQGGGGAGGGLVASGPAIVAAEQEDAYFTMPGCRFSARIAGDSVVPTFSCTVGALPQQATIGGTMELVSAFAE